MSIKEIKQGDLILARYIPADIAWTEGLSFFSSDEEYVQVGTWGYNSGKELLAHTHNKAPREIDWTQEVLYVRQGRIRAEIYDTNEECVATLEAGSGDIVILLRGGHGYHILEEDTQVLEIKNGPYLGADKDRKRLK